MNKAKRNVTKLVVLALMLTASIALIKIIKTSAAVEVSQSAALTGNNIVAVNANGFSGQQAARNDFVGTITSNNGAAWGSWGEAVFCPAGTYIAGMAQRVEASQGSGDDTALNTVAIYCTDKEGTKQKPITLAGGKWGSWGQKSNCASGKFINGFKLKVESNQGGGDDTGLNSISVQCDDGANFELSNGGKWGGWGKMQACPTNSAACGVSLRVETDQGGGDDTAANDLKCHCCKL